MSAKSSPKSGGKQGVEVRNAFSPRIPVFETNDEPSMTQQHFKDSCDINQIVAKFQTTGVINHVKQYGDVYGEMDGATFTDNMMAVTRAQNMFNDLPSSTREFFDHDPAKFLDYVDCLDEASDLAEAAQLGLLDPDSPSYALAMNGAQNASQAVSQHEAENPQIPSPDAGETVSE